MFCSVGLVIVKNKQYGRTLFFQFLVIAFATVFIFPSNVNAVPTLQWDQTSIQGRNVRLLASANGQIRKWCLKIDGRAITEDVVGTRYQDGQLYGTPFNSSTGCWESVSNVIFAAFYVPMSSISSGQRVFELIVTDALGESVSISRVIEVVHIPPAIQWDWKEDSRGSIVSPASGVISYGFSSTDPIAKWCYLLDQGTVALNNARPRGAERSDVVNAKYDSATGCWQQIEGNGPLFKGMFIIPTQTLKNGNHDIQLTATDTYGVSSSLSATFVSKNSTQVSHFSVSTYEKPFPSKSSNVRVTATTGNANRFEIRLGSSKKNLRTIKKGTIKDGGEIISQIGSFRAKSVFYVQVVVSGPNGRKTSIQRVTVPPALPNPYRTDLPRVSLPPLKLFIPGLSPAGPQPSFVSKACTKRLTGIVSDWKGRGFSWTEWGILSNGTKTIVKTGHGWDYPSNGFEGVPIGCVESPR